MSSAAKQPDPHPCEGCGYWRKTTPVPHCRYYMLTGKHRITDGNNTCLVRTDSKPANPFHNFKIPPRTPQSKPRKSEYRRAASWDTDKGKRMYILGESYFTIAEACDTTYESVKNTQRSTGLTSTGLKGGGSCESDAPS